MRNVLLTFSLLLFAGMSFGQIKVITSGFTGIGTSAPVEQLHVGGNMALDNPDGTTNASKRNHSIYGVGDAKRLQVSTNSTTSSSSSFFQMFGAETNSAPQVARAGEFLCSGKYFNVVTNKPAGSVGGFGVLHFSVDAAGVVSNPFGSTASNSFRIIADSDKLSKAAGDFNYGLNEVLQMAPKQYTSEIAGKSASSSAVAVMAQDMAKIAPEVVSTLEYNDHDNGVYEKVETIDMTAITFMLVNSIQEQQELIEAQNERIAEMEAMILNMANGTTQAVEVRDSRLGQNAPNPFNQSTVISYTVPTKSNTAVMQIFDLNGQLLKTVNVANGNGQLTINAGELAAGTYSYNLVVDGAIVDTKKMVLTK